MQHTLLLPQESSARDVAAIVISLLSIYVMFGHSVLGN